MGDHNLLSKHDNFLLNWPLEKNSPFFHFLLADLLTERRSRKTFISHAPNLRLTKGKSIDPQYSCPCLWHLGYNFTFKAFPDKRSKKLCKRDDGLADARLFQGRHVGIAPFHRHNGPRVAAGREHH